MSVAQSILTQNDDKEDKLKLSQYARNNNVFALDQINLNDSSIMKISALLNFLVILNYFQCARPIAAVGRSERAIFYSVFATGFADVCLWSR